MIRKTAGKYVKSEDALYQVLHAKWPDIAKENFKIKVCAIVRGHRDLSLRTIQAPYGHMEL